MNTVSAGDNINAEVRERLLFLLHCNTLRSSEKYKYLEKQFGISARRWKNVCNRVQMPGIDMLSLIIVNRPEYATWLMCGQSLNGKQSDPTLENGLEEGQINLAVKGWEENYDRIQKAEYLKRFEK